MSTRSRITRQRSTTTLMLQVSLESELTLDIEIEPHETIYSNRAACFIQTKDYKRALEDCQAAIRVNPQFSKIYKRLFKANLGMGNIQEAESALKRAIQIDPTDATNKADQNLMDEVLHQQKMIEKYGAEDNGMNEDIDYDKAQNYCKSILKNCPLAVNYMAMRVMYLLKSNQLKEAEAYSKELVERTDIPYTQMSILQSWRARVMIYSGNEVLGEKLLRQCLQNDPDNSDA